VREQEPRVGALARESGDSAPAEERRARSGRSAPVPSPPPCPGGTDGRETSAPVSVWPLITPASALPAPFFRRGGSPPPMVTKPSERLAELGLALPPPPRPAGTYSPVVRDGERAWVSGQIVTEGGAVVHPGLVDRDVPADVARDLARRAALQALSALTAELGSIDQIRRFLRVTVYVASSPGFGRQHEVANGATDLLVQLFGDAGRPARAAVGVACLPLNAPVEVEFLVATGPSR